MGTLCIIAVCFGFPAIALGMLQHRHNVIVPFFIGTLTFVISQLLLRLPLLQLLQQNVDIQIAMQIHVVPYFVFLALTAGVFEEIGRYLGFRCMKKHRTMYDAAALGLGHGAVEAILLTALPIISMGILPLADTVMASIERISAMLAHVAFTLIVWKGITSHKGNYLIMAILLHAVYDFLAVMLVYSGIAIAVIEAALLMVSILMLSLCYIFIVKKEGV